MDALLHGCFPVCRVKGTGNSNILNQDTRRNKIKMTWEGLPQLKHSTTEPDVLPQLCPYSQHVNHAFYLCTNTSRIRREFHSKKISPTIPLKISVLHLRIREGLKWPNLSTVRIKVTTLADARTKRITDICITVTDYCFQKGFRV